MLVLGIIVILGMGLHLWNFWAKMMLVELAPCAGDHHLATNGVYWIAETFSCPVYTVIYLVWLAALWMHLNHGLWSSMQTLGWSGKVWFNRWRCISCIAATVIILMFVAVAVAFCFGYRPADFDAVVAGAGAVSDACHALGC
jgi:succinate dehydrogenase / fumarate reductase cytochrome b subunit